MIHSDKHWFVTFIDDCTCLTWLYPSTKKTEVKEVFVRFYNMIATQFQTKIHILHSDNGTKYFNEQLTNFCKIRVFSIKLRVEILLSKMALLSEKIHLLEVVPKYLWGDVVLAVAYLKNRMPTEVLNFKTPLNHFSEFFPTIRLFFDLLIKF